MATTLEIIRGISQAAANAYDGALDEDGKPLKIGLRREEGDPIIDSRVMDGFGVKFHGNLLRITYQSDIKLKEVYGGGFEDEIGRVINSVASFLKREYKKVTGDTLTLTKVGDPDMIVQETSRVRSWVQASCDYKIGGINDVEPVGEAGEEKLDKAIKNWLGSNGNLKRATGTGMYGKDTHAGTKKPQNVKGKRDLEPRS